MQKQPRPHAELIIAWANGAEIQGRKPGTEEWKDYADPAFVDGWEYRVKPERVYPVSELSGDALHDFLCERNSMMTTHNEDMRQLANFVLRHAIDNGQVVTREEFDKLAAELESEKKSFVYRGQKYFPGAVIRVKA